MPLSIVAILVVIALITTILSATGRCPLYVPVLLLVIVEMLQLFPVK